MWRRILFYTSATIIVSLAALVTLFQLLSPYLNDRRSDFENWVSTWLNMPVHIEQVSAEWHRYYPVINLQNVKVYHPTTKIPLLDVKKISAFISIPSSIWHWKIVLNSFLIKGTRIEVYQNDKNEFILKGFPELKTKQTSDTPLDDLINAFANQPTLILQDCDVLFTSKEKKQYNLNVHSLKIANNAKNHQFNADVLLYQQIPTVLTVQANWEGTVFNLKNINANVYLYARGLSLGQLLDYFPYQNLAISQGILNTKNWLRFENGELSSLQTQFEILNAKLSNQKKNNLALHNFSGEMSVEKKSDYWLVNGNDILIHTATFDWPKTAFSAILVKNQEKFLVRELSIDYLKLDELLSWRVFLPPDFLNNLEPHLTQLDLKGEIEELKLNFMPENDYQINNIAATFNNLSFNEKQPYPGVKYLSGTLKADRETGVLDLNSSKMQLTYTNYFSHPLSINTVQGKINWQKTNDNNWLFTTDSLQLSNDVLTADANGSLRIPNDNSSPIIDLNASFSVDKAASIYPFFPDKIFEKGLTNWLAQAFLKGKVQNGQLKLQGILNQFPFDQQGTFLVTGDVEDVDFRYAPLWPIVKSVNGTITFSGRKIIIEASKGNLHDVDIGHVSAIIPYLGEDKPAIVEIKGQPLNIDLAKGTEFLLKTPLRNTYGKILESLNPEGAATLALRLTVPLHNPDDTIIKGDLDIHDSQLTMSKWGLKITKLNGALTFTEKDITANNLQGILFQKPIGLRLNTIQKNNQTFVNANFITRINVDDLENWLKLKLKDQAQGETDVSGVVALSLKEPVTVNLQSNLLGVALKIQKPYHKDVNEKRPLYLEVIAASKPPLKLRFNYNENLNGALLINNAKSQFNIEALTLLLGKGDASWPTEKGLKITGVIDQIDWDDMSNYINASDNSGINLPLKAIDIKTNEFQIFNQSLRDLRIIADVEPNYWNVSVAGKTIQGNLKIPTHFSRNEMITVQLDNLDLSSQGSQGRAAQFNLQNLPAISFNANQMQFNQLKLGRVNFRTDTSGNGVAIRDLTITSNNLKLKGSGWWTKRGGSHYTQLSGTATSNNVSALLQSFDYDVRNYILRNGQLKYNLSWSNAPYAPELSSMSGTVSMKMGKGRILEVKETGGAKMDLGRMLSIFSLQTIPRRLSLDFSDVFQSGYSFDNFQGDFNFKGGSIATNNTYFEGPVARINISGTIGLINKDYHLNLGITPHVTSSIPVAATLLTANPVVGVAAIAASNVLGAAISKAATYHYTVTGPWSNPTWTSVSVSSKKR